MLDVHGPHDTAHTWRSFFIHIATIVIGRFIAVALEQLVEMIRRKSFDNYEVPHVPPALK
jgi:hypothetical protein